MQRKSVRGEPRAGSAQASQHYQAQTNVRAAARDAQSQLRRHLAGGARIVVVEHSNSY
ncbi:MAG: hypothetical protein JO247_14310 [Chloroflexi bacterium]|nr:hypothetical protein [Chloroflexota bacterium]